MSNIPKLTVSVVESHFYAPYFERGLNYYNRGHIFDTIRRDNGIEARCSGSMPSPYRVRAVLSSAGIESTDCTCPIGGGCKHAAALLLTWVHAPGEFEVRESVDDLLAQRGKNELIVLIREMIKREPDLELLLDLPLPGRRPRGEPVDPEPYRRQARSAFYGADEWGASFGVASELSAIVDMAGQFAEAEDWRNAQIIYQVVVEEGLSNYEHAVHDEGEILAEIDRAAEGLAECLHAFGEDSVTRQGLLRSLFEVISWDINVGGYGVGDTIPAILLEQANADERQLLREWIMREAAKADGMEEHSRKWRKDAWGRMLLQLDERDGDIDGFLERARSQGMYRSLLDKLIELGRVEEAVEVAAVHMRSSDYDFLQAAQSLEHAGYVSEAFKMVAADSAGIEDTRLLGWLAEKFEAQGDLQGTLHLQMRRWESRPSLEDFQTLERIAAGLGQWESLRTSLLAGLTKSDDFSVLARIHLYEQDWDAAWDAATRGAKPHWHIGIQEEVARATEQHRPQKASAYYRSRAEQLITRRGRGNYASAAEYLQRARRIYETVGQTETWQREITTIRENNRNLPALQDELNKAGL